jgi:hypothetical protein
MSDDLKERLLQLANVQITPGQKTMAEAFDRIAELEARLQRIAGGCIPGLTDLVLAGDWHGAFTLMQAEASKSRAALGDSSDD